MSGELIITDKTTDYEDGTSIKIYANDILKFVAGHIRNQRIGEIESMDWREVLK
jgi:hypothetical protein